MTNYLVIGATGTVGRSVCTQLAALGHRVRGVTRNPAAELPDGVERVVADLTDPAALDGLVDGVDGVHLLTVDGTGSPLPAALGTAIGAAGVRRVTVLQDGWGAGPVEQALTDAGVAWTGLSGVAFMSNTLEWASSIRERGEVRAGYLDNPGAVVHEADIAAVAVTALTEDGHAGAVYPITGPRAVTDRERIEILAAALGRDIRIVELTEDETEAAWRAEGYGDDDIAFFRQMSTDPPEVAYTVQDTVTRLTGAPGRTFEQWCAENADRFR